jgi:hypothetical protein
VRSKLARNPRRIDMTRIATCTSIALCLLLASAPAHAARARRQLLDLDALGIPAHGVTAELRLVRTESYTIILTDILVESLTGQPTTQPRTTPLGFSLPTGPAFGSYAADGDGVVYCAVSAEAGVRIFQLGDLTVPGPLAPVELESFRAGDGFVPASTQMNIIAILIDGLVERRPAFSVTSFVDGTSNTITFAWSGSSFEKVVPVGDGTWVFDRPQ